MSTPHTIDLVRRPFGAAGEHGQPSTQAAGAVPAELAFPVIEAAFPRQRHPYWPTLRQRTRAWLEDMRLMPPVEAERYVDRLCYTDLMADYYLGAPDAVLQAITDYSAWFFVWDDRHDRDVVHGRVGAWRRLRFQLHAALDAPDDHLRHRDPLVAGLAHSLVRLYAYLGQSWNDRFARHFHAVIEAYNREFDNRRSGTVPAVDDYLALRRLTFAHAIWTDLLELSAGLELPADVREHPAYQRTGLLSQEFAAWYNDLCSLPKELAGGDVHNLGISLIHHHGLSQPEATAEIRQRIANCISQFLASEPDVRRLAGRLADGTAQGNARGAAVNACLANMRNWFSAVYWFHHESYRYMVSSWTDQATPPYVIHLGGRR